LDEGDILLCSDIRDFLLAEKPKIGFQFPDIDYKVIMGQNFAGGMLNFSPYDMLSNVAIRADKHIKKYADTVRSYVQNASSEAAERHLIEGMKETYKDTKTERKIENVYEFLSLAVKPIHYLPIAGNILAAVEDASDVAMRRMDGDKADREWYLLASKATAVSIEDYLRRKENL